jgi:hypothetical protein
MHRFRFTPPEELRNAKSIRLHPLPSYLPRKQAVLASDRGNCRIRRGKPKLLSNGTSRAQIPSSTIDKMNLLILTD